jgi:hypothetical protein
VRPVRHKKRPHGHESKSHPDSNPPSDSIEKHKDTKPSYDEAKNKQTPPEKRFWNMSRAEWTMAVLTFIGIVVACLTGAIFWEQLGAMKTDQRAWVTLTFPNPTPEPTRTTAADGATITGVTITIPITAVDTGKTPAKHYSVDIAVEEVPITKTSTLSYAGPISRTVTGIMFPNSPLIINAGLLEATPNAPDAINGVVSKTLTPVQFQSLVDGKECKEYMILYAKSSYIDIFGTPHWHHYCVFWTYSVKPVTAPSKNCTDYNDVDEN